MSPEERRKNQRDNQNFFSEKLSDLCRYIAFGVLAAYVAVLSQDKAFYKAVRSDSGELFRFAAMCAVAVVVADFAQMILGFLASKRAAENTDGDYRKTSAGEMLSLTQEFMFGSKLILCLASSILVLVAIAKVSLA